MQCSNEWKMICEMKHKDENTRQDNMMRNKCWHCLMSITFIRVLLWFKMHEVEQAAWPPVMFSKAGPIRVNCLDTSSVADALVVSPHGGNSSAVSSLPQNNFPVIKQIYGRQLTRCGCRGWAGGWWCSGVLLVNVSSVAAVAALPPNDSTDLCRLWWSGLLGGWMSRETGSWFFCCPLLIWRLNMSFRVWKISKVEMN